MFWARRAYCSHPPVSKGYVQGLCDLLWYIFRTFPLCQALARPWLYDGLNVVVVCPHNCYLSPAKVLLWPNRTSFMPDHRFARYRAF